MQPPWVFGDLGSCCSLPVWLVRARRRRIARREPPSATRRSESAGRERRSSRPRLPCSKRREPQRVRKATQIVARGPLKVDRSWSAPAPVSDAAAAPASDVRGPELAPWAAAWADPTTDHVPLAGLDHGLDPRRRPVSSLRLVTVEDDGNLSSDEYRSHALLRLEWRVPVDRGVSLLGSLAASRYLDESLTDSLSDPEFAWVGVGFEFGF